MTALASSPGAGQPERPRVAFRGVDCGEDVYAWNEVVRGGDQRGEHCEASGHSAANRGDPDAREGAGGSTEVRSEAPVRCLQGHESEIASRNT